jgi:hypothetical protein
LAWPDGVESTASSLPGWTKTMVSTCAKTRRRGIGLSYGPGRWIAVGLRLGSGGLFW